MENKDEYGRTERMSEYDMNAIIMRKNKLADRFLEINNDLRRMDKKLLMLMKTEFLEELGKELVKAYKVLEEIKAKQPGIAEALNQQVVSIVPPKEKKRY